MYGEQLRSVAPLASQAPRKRTISTSTRVTSSRSNVIAGPLSRICFSNSSKCSACIRPISRIVVLFPSEYFSIFNVIFDPSDDSRVQRWQYIEIKCLASGMGRNPRWEDHAELSPGLTVLVVGLYFFDLNAGLSQQERGREVIPERVACEVEFLKFVPLRREDGAGE